MILKLMFMCRLSCEVIGNSDCQAFLVSLCGGLFGSSRCFAVSRVSMSGEPSELKMVGGLRCQLSGA